LLFTPTGTADKNLKREHVSGRIIHTGDLSVEIINRALKKLVSESVILDKYNLDSHDYLLMTMHRAENTNSKDSMVSLLRSFEILSEKEKELQILFPIHPRTANFIRRVNLYSRLKRCKNVRVIKPVGYIDFIALMRNAKKIVTDSGGVQKESYLLGIPCITIRKNTEWVETVRVGANILTGTNTDQIVKAITDWMPTSRVFRKRKIIFGDGRASEKIRNSLKADL
jgi:UDP-N-acetylglucosamine 2-epimerase (non-hydrolysing)